MNTCSCTMDHHDERRCERCNFHCDGGRPVMWPAPDFDKWDVVIDDDLVIFRKKG